MAISGELDKVVPDLLRTHGVPGGAVALVRDGVVTWARGFGHADAAQGVPVTHRTVFQVASISKTVTAWGIMWLAERGQLSLDAPAERYLTRWHLPPSRFDHSGVTVRRLLSHTAGISVHGVKGFEPDAALPSLEEYFSDAGRDGAVRVVQAPGAGYRYSGGGYTMLQLIVEEVMGRPFAAFMQETVLEPLGMEHSSFVWRPDLRPATACAYDSKGKRVPNFLFAAQAAAGLYTTAADLGTFVAAGLRGPHGEAPGRGVLSAESIEFLYHPVADTDWVPGVRYGLGYTVKTLWGGVKVVGHTGDNWGWKARFSALPDASAGLIVLTNSDNGWVMHDAIYRDWVRETAGVEDPIRFFGATVLSGGVLVTGIPERGPWESSRLVWLSEHEIDSAPAEVAGDGRITRWAELEAVLNAPAGPGPVRKVWIHETLGYRVEMLCEDRWASRS